MSKGSDPKKVIVQLTGEDGNAFFIIGRVSKALKTHGQPEQAAEYVKKASASESYDDMLQLTMQYVNVA